MTRENYMKIPVPVKHKGGFTGTQPRTLASSVSPEVASEPPSPEAARPTRPKAPTLWPLMEPGADPHQHPGPLLGPSSASCVPWVPHRQPQGHLSLWSWLSPPALPLPSPPHPCSQLPLPSLWTSHHVNPHGRMGGGGWQTAHPPGGYLHVCPEGPPLPSLTGLSARGSLGSGETPRPPGTCPATQHRAEPPGRPDRLFQTGMPRLQLCRHRPPFIQRSHEGTPAALLPRGGGHLSRRQR